MKLLKRTIICLVFAASVVAFSGCNTVDGFGEDMEDAGEAIQDGSN